MRKKRPTLPRQPIDTAQKTPHLAASAHRHRAKNTPPCRAPIDAT
ncbi:hypothetical protein [Lysobacter gummosus]